MPGALLHHGLEQAVSRFGDRDAILVEEERWTFGDVERASNSFAAHLASKGVGPGARVALMTANRPEFVVAVYAISKLGAAAVLLNPSWKAVEVGNAFELTAPMHAFADSLSAALLEEHLGSNNVTNLDEHIHADGSVPAIARESVSSGAEVVLVFSSGTTGMPKAVRHTHGSIAAAIRHWTDSLGLGPNDRFQVATPPSHILGLLNLVTAVSAGATVRLHRRFDLDTVLHDIETEKMTLEMAVAPIALAMANHPDLEQYDLSSLRYIMWGATPVTASVAEKVTRRTGVRWLPAYGASELPVLAANPVGRPEAWRLDSAGLPPAGVELRIADLDSGDTLAPGEVGEIQARSASVMAGYLPEKDNVDAFAGGWYRTGDVGWLEPEGWVHITDRSKEMIKVSGFQVAPAEVEAVLHGHVGVVDCAVFGVAEERTGEVPVAAVQLDKSSPPSTDELMKLVSDSLAPYKRLHHVIVVESIPRLPSGKVLRRELRMEWEPRLKSGAEKPWT